VDPAARKELETIKQAILDTVRANEIYLFGSYASGTPDKDSDFDVYVVIPDDSMRPIEAMQKIGRALSRKDIRAVDVIVGKETVFNQRKGLPTIERAIARDGVKLYG
jgi:predicted nucleotidyltransferase